MSSRLEFVKLAAAEDADIRQLCRRYVISPKTGYKWISRYKEQGPEGLKDASRRPNNSPNQTPPEVESAVVRIREEHPAWGGRKIRWQLEQEKKKQKKQKKKALIVLPSASTITEILRRHQLLDPQESAARVPYKSFEHPSPNCLWQMDFKGHFPIAQGRCYPLSVLDDHSRFSVDMEACGNEQGLTVQSRLTPIFRRYGLPDAMLMDNGSPWGSSQAHPYTPLVAWLIRLDKKP